MAFLLLKRGSGIPPGGRNDRREGRQGCLETLAIIATTG